MADLATETPKRPRGAVDILGPGGPLARAFERYEVREEQLAMASAVERALEKEQVLICEAGTGTGKTLAYLVPAILSGKKVIISTATRALQDQIFTKDLPLIAGTLGRDVDAALMKGLGNYLCRRRLAEFERSEESFRPSHAKSLQTIQHWREESEYGDIAELRGLGESDPIWSHITSSSDTRVGAECDYFDECFVTRMKRDAERARIVVVNHHLFFADLALRGPHPARVLPNYDAVVFDEAHQLEDIATEFFGIRVSSTKLERMLADAERLYFGRKARNKARSLPTPMATLQQAANNLWQALGMSLPLRDARITLDRDIWSGDVLETYHRLDTALEAFAGWVGSLDGSAQLTLAGSSKPFNKEAAEIAQRRAQQARSDLASIVEGSPGRVTWLEDTPRGRVLSSSPVDLSQTFRQNIFDSIPAVVLTSATLSTAPTSSTKGGFGFLKARLGMDASEADIQELTVSSPFDYSGQALLYTPRDLPAPNDAKFCEPAAKRIQELIELTDGGCFVLTTSLRAMRALHEQLSHHGGTRPLLLQGQAPKASLLSAFRASGRAVLVATSSFWQGVDVPGHALRLVVLDKIPFAVPTDPVLKARAELIEEAGGNPFNELHVPTAAIALKQGFGRLIRTRNDAGIVALLDGRVLTRGYGKRLLATLPDVEKTDQMDRVSEFWRKVEGAFGTNPQTPSSTGS